MITKDESIKTIKFSHDYKKFPPVLAGTYLKGLRIKHYDDLTEDFIRKDTEIVDGTFYKLPKTKLMILDLWTAGKYWTTVRPWNRQKEEYYQSLLGQEVRIVVEK